MCLSLSNVRCIRIRLRVRVRVRVRSNVRYIRLTLTLTLTLCDVYGFEQTRIKIHIAHLTVPAGSLRAARGRPCCSL